MAAYPVGVIASTGVCASGEMADALASGASARKGVGVQVPPRAQEKIPGSGRGFLFAQS